MRLLIAFAVLAAPMWGTARAGPVEGRAADPGGVIESDELARIEILSPSGQRELREATIRPTAPPVNGSPSANGGT